MSSESSPTENAGHIILDEALQILQQFDSDFGMFVSRSSAAQTFAEIVVQNKLTFVRLTWSPSDGFRYYVGPLKDGEIPPAGISYTPGQSLREYELEWFSTLKSVPIRCDLRGKTSGARSALANGIAFLVTCAEEFLKGDWSRRPELDGFIKRNYELRQP